MKELIEQCKKAIAEGRCLGCTALENPNFNGNSNCRYNKAEYKAEQMRLSFKERK